jgi:hypothetical protein
MTISSRQPACISFWAEGDGWSGLKPKSQKMYQVPQIIVMLRYTCYPFTYCADFSFSVTLGFFASALVRLLLGGGGLLPVIHACITVTVKFTLNSKQWLTSGGRLRITTLQSIYNKIIINGRLHKQYNIIAKYWITLIRLDFLL